MFLKYLKYLHKTTCMNLYVSSMYIYVYNNCIMTSQNKIKYTTYIESCSKVYNYNLGEKVEVSA